MCKDCAVKYYRLQGRCAKCPQGAYLLIVGYTCAIVFLVGLLATARMKGVNLTALGIGVDFLQVVSVFTSFGFKWPIQLTTLFNAASISSFNEQLMAPECSIGSWSFGTKWYIMQGIPLVLLVGLAGLLCTRRLRSLRQRLLRGPGRLAAPTSTHLRRLLGRDRLAAIEDSYCGICIIMLYFLYLTVTKGALSVFDCTINKSGVFLLDADPSIRCYEEGSVQQTLVPPAILSLLVYTIGIPMTFLAILVIHGPAIKLDQTMRAANQGGTEASNPEYYIRKRYQELYSLFRPDMYWWRLVLTVRKFCFVGVALMFSSTPLFQACISVGILFISYALHVHFHPFLDPVKADAVHDRHGASFLTRGVKLVYTFKYNTLETLYLVTSLFILLAGMAFQSGVATVGSGPHVVLTWLVAVVLVTCIGLFVGVLSVEVWQSIKFARRVAVVMRKAASTSGPRRATSVIRSSESASLPAAGGWIVSNPLNLKDPISGPPQAGSSHVSAAPASVSVGAPRTVGDIPAGASAPRAPPPPPATGAPSAVASGPGQLPSLATAARTSFPQSAYNRSHGGFGLPTPPSSTSSSANVQAAARGAGAGGGGERYARIHSMRLPALATARVTLATLPVPEASSATPGLPQGPLLGDSSDHSNDDSTGTLAESQVARN